MLFNSNAFIVGFLPATLVLYYLTRRYFSQRTQFSFLFIASLVFYSYWDIRYFPLILASIIFSHRSSSTTGWPGRSCPAGTRCCGRAFCST